MFCKNCGSRIPDNAKFCGKCGMAASQTVLHTGDGSSLVQGQGGKSGRKNPLSGLNMRVAAGGVAAVLFLVTVLGVCLVRNGGTLWKESEDRDAASAETGTRNHDIITLNVSSDITLEGNYENLQSVKMAPSADGPAYVITYSENASFPALESLECSAVFKISDSGDRGWFDERDFPKLSDVTMKVVNKYIDEDIIMTYLIFQDMYDAGRLQSFRIENSYTVEDLYGTWTDERRTLSLTFTDKGTVRVADSNNFFGVDVLKYKELDKDTLSLSADTSNLFSRVSVSMKYEIFGNRLKVEFLGKEFVLTRQ